MCLRLVKFIGVGSYFKVASDYTYLASDCGESFCVIVFCVKILSCDVLSFNLSKDVFYKLRIVVVGCKFLFVVFCISSVRSAFACAAGGSYCI